MKDIILSLPDIRFILAALERSKTLENEHPAVKLHALVIQNKIVEQVTKR